MIGTNYATRGFRRITRLEPPVKVRFVGFVLVVICGSAALAWLTRTTWHQLQRLQTEYAAVKSESFYLGVTLRSTIRSLNGKLLQFGLSREQEVQEEFSTEAQDLRLLLETNRVHLTELSNLRPVRRVGRASELELLQRIKDGYETYLEETAPILKSGDMPRDLDRFEEIYGRVQSSSRPLLALCNQLVEVQSEAFTGFLGETQRTLENHKRLLQATSVLILSLAGMLTLLVYRGMIAPLRKGLRQSRKVIERQEKLASLGVLASGMAHEIRNPLTAIKFRLFSLKKSVPALEQNEDAAVIAEDLNRLEQIVKDVLRFARPSEPALVTMEARDIVGDAHNFLQGQLERSGILLKMGQEAEARVHADGQQMKQVMINLIQNAAEAIGRNGTITLSTRVEETELEGRTRPAVVLAVADTGKGITPEVEMRLFDPFFTTKEGGTGLGLSIAARIVGKHGGILRYDTQVNRGTTFEIVLPRVENEPSKTAAD